MNRFSKILLGLVLIIGIAFPITGVAQAANGNEKLLGNDSAPEGQGGIATPTPIRVRMNGSATAYYASVTPTIDGNWSDWSSPENPARFVVTGGENRSGIADLDAAYKLGWDDYYLYMAVKMRDDKYVQDARIDQLYKGDSIDILLDTDFFGDFDTPPSLNNDDYQIAISPGHGGPSGPKQAFVYFPANKAGPRDDIDIATIRSGGVTRFEIAIPWTTFNVTPHEGDKFGFAIGVSDNDDPTRDIQQTFMSNIRKRVLANPTTWGDLTLKGKTINGSVPTSSPYLPTAVPPIPTSLPPVPTNIPSAPNCLSSLLKYSSVIYLAPNSTETVTKSGGQMRIQYDRVYGSIKTFTIQVDSAGVVTPYFLKTGGYIDFGTPGKGTHTVTIINNGDANERLTITEFVSVESDTYCQIP